MPADLPSIRARLAAATPGERTIRPCLSWWRVFAGEACIAEPNELADAALIAHAPSDLAALVDDVERLRADLTEALSVVAAYRSIVSRLPRTCDRCGASGKWDGALFVHIECGGRLE